MELGVASYLNKAVFFMQPTGQKAEHEIRKVTVLNLNLDIIPKELLG